MMHHPAKATEALLDELMVLRRRVAELEGAAARSLEKAPAPPTLTEPRALGGASGGVGPGFTEQTLEEREAKLRSIFRAAPSGIGVVANRLLVEVNDRICLMTGYAVEELVGQSARILYPTQEEYDYVGREKYRQIAEQGIGTVETRWQRKDGTILDVLLSSTPIKPDDLSAGVTFTALDITERKRAEQALRQSEEKFRTVVDNAKDAIFIHDLDGHIVEANREACERLGYSRDEFLRMTPQDVDTPEQAVFVSERIQTLLRQEHHLFETVHRRRDGSTLPIEVSTRIFELAGKRLVLSVCRDLTERKLAEQERRELEAQMQQAQKLESLGVLAGGMAHDFNNILTAIMGHAGLALADLAAESPARENLREIEHAARRASELCRQMLAYSGKGRFLVEPINLNRLVQELSHLFEFSISKKTALQYHFAENLPAIDGDAAQIRQVVMNLILNASESLEGREGTVGIATGTRVCDRAFFSGGLTKEVPPAGTYVYLEVSDTGCGMDAEKQSKIFDPFFTTKFTGRGLGLAAVLGIVRSHKGAIHVVSEPGEGTRFTVFFPASTNVPASLPPPTPGEPWCGSGTILLVDDEVSIRSVARKTMERSGFQVLTASDGREAIAIFRERASEIVCVVLDLTMPHMDGEETLRELRRIQPTVPVILTSGYSAEEITSRFAGQALAGFIEKPYEIGVLTAKLRDVLTPNGTPLSPNPNPSAAR
jgi:PAS domain S-box-containing protein